MYVLYLQLLVDVGLVYQGVENIQHRVHIPNLAEANQHVERLEDQTFHHFPKFSLRTRFKHYLWIPLQCFYFILGFLCQLAAELAECLA